MMKAPVSLKINDLAARALKDFLSQVPALARADNIQVALSQQEPDVDLIAQVRAFRVTHTLVASVLRDGQPRHVRSAILPLKEFVSRQAGSATPIVIAPYLSPAAIEICRAADIAYLDLEGNARLAFGTFFMSQETSRKPVAERRMLRSIFKPKSSQVLKVMLRDPARAWRVAELSEAAGVSLGHVSNVRGGLLDREWARLTDDGLYLAAPDALLDAWCDAYEPPAGQTLSFYTTLHGAGMDAAMKSLGAGASGHVALCSFSAAQWLAPYARTGTQHFFADTTGLERLQSSLSLTGASKGENVVVTVVDDLALLGDTVEPAPDMICTSPVQTYLDLAKAGERGREAADHLRQQRLTWLQTRRERPNTQASMTTARRRPSNQSS